MSDVLATWPLKNCRENPGGILYASLIRPVSCKRVFNTSAPRNALQIPCLNKRSIRTCTHEPMINMLPPDWVCNHDAVSDCNPVVWRLSFVILEVYQWGLARFSGYNSIVANEKHPRKRSALQVIVSSTSSKPSKRLKNHPGTGMSGFRLLIKSFARCSVCGGKMSPRVPKFISTTRSQVKPTE
jgi:hypothetical protein